MKRRLVRWTVLAALAGFAGLALRPLWGQPRRPGEKYALVVGVREPAHEIQNLAGGVEVHGHVLVDQSAHRIQHIEGAQNKLVFLSQE